MRDETGRIIGKGVQLFPFFVCKVMQVEVLFVCFVLKFWWQSSLIIEHLSPSELQFLPGPVSTVRSTCCSFEFKSTHTFVLLLDFLFIMLTIAHHESV